MQLVERGATKKPQIQWICGFLVALLGSSVSMGKKAYGTNSNEYVNLTYKSYLL